MFKIFAVILVCAVCMSSVAEASAAAVVADSSPVQNLNHKQINAIGTQIGVPLLTSNRGPFASLVAASMPPRAYVGESRPVLIRTPTGLRFIGESVLAMVAM